MRPSDLFLPLLSRAKRSSDVVLAVVLAMIIGAMIVPLPEWALDAGLALNLAAALSLLVAALSARDALKVASFPTLLLLTTLFRLAMNVSSTRLALSEGRAGDVIQAFGEFVVRGDFVVGAVIFCILTLVQFLVVTKGAERVAEVSARFTLDAMPGKQMSIDADLRSGAITQEQARGRRRELERESQLFGAMDGAMKFVKGDVIAGLVITLINLLGGTAIGVLQQGLSAGEAASTYALIAIGDGLVSQIPSLCIAVAAGLVVTRVSSEREESSLGADIGAQFFGQWKALLVVAGLCGLLGLMPGMPHVIFGLIAAALAGLGFALRRAASTGGDTATPTAPGAPVRGPGASATGQPAREESTGVMPLTLDLSPELSGLAAAGSRFVEDALGAIRERLYTQLGVRLPAVRVRTGAPLAPGTFTLAIDEVPALTGRLAVDVVYSVATPADLLVLSIAQRGETNLAGRAFVALDPAERERLERARLPVCTPAELLVEAIVHALSQRAALFVGVQEVQALVEGLEKSAPALTKEALQKVPLTLLTEVLRRLLREQVSIKNLRRILETLVSPAAEGDAGALADACRAGLHRQLTHQYSVQGQLLAYLVDPAVEEVLRQAGPSLAVEPSTLSAIHQGVRRLSSQGRGVLLASPDVRRGLRRLLEGQFPDMAVLSFGELDRELQIRPLGQLKAAAA
ncbi:MAG: flagellar biosynthesis protein FlhA [Myxococcaceae bacterium]|nr:flagellar biosynthesis protein FlhA [Myxococcaceae bacterium]